MSTNTKIYLGVVIVIIIISFIVAIFYVKTDNKKWNDGKCECGGSYIYKEAVGHRNYTSYIYECDECGNHIELYTEIK